MRSLTLAYRDDDRTPVIFAIRAMAARHYDLDVRIVKIKDGGDYEAALFNGASQAIANTYEIATIEYPAAKRLNPLTLWDLHWVKGLDDAGFIDDLGSGSHFKLTRAVIAPSHRRKPVSSLLGKPGFRRPPE